MRPPSMSGHFLLAPIPESSSDYLLPRDIKLAVLGASRVGKSGECPGDPAWPGPLGAGDQLAAAAGGGQRAERSPDVPPAWFPGCVPEHLSTGGLSPGLAPVGERGSGRQVEGLQSSRHLGAGGYDGRPLRFAVCGPSLRPCPLRASRFDGLVGGLQVIFLFSSQQ